MKKVVGLLILLFGIIFSISIYYFGFYNKNNDVIFASVTLPHFENILLDVNNINIQLNEHSFELPLNGSSGYASVNINMYDKNRNIIKVLYPGNVFKIIDEVGEFLYIFDGKQYGYVDKLYVMINLPDVIPSIIYDNTNSYKSMFRSDGKDLEGITNNKLYDTYMYNDRYKKDMFVVPILYETAKKIAKVQNEALKNGDSLIIYETYRPFEVQREVLDKFTDLIREDSEVNSLVNSKPWNTGWFISTRVSNHQRGIAIDSSIVKINKAHKSKVGEYNFISISNYTLYEMPSPIHELSSKSSLFSYPVSSTSKTSFKNATFSNTINDNAIKLYNYYINNGFYPLASEWWHYNDLDTLEKLEVKSNGNFYINDIMSSVPIKNSEN